MSRTRVQKTVSEIPQQPESIAVSRPKRDIRKPARYTDLVVYALPVTENDVPETYREAAQGADSANWRKAMDEEMGSLSMIMGLGIWFSFRRERKQLVASGFMRRRRIQDQRGQIQG